MVPGGWLRADSLATVDSGFLVGLPGILTAPVFGRGEPRIFHARGKIPGSEQGNEFTDSG